MGAIVEIDVLIDGCVYPVAAILSLLSVCVKRVWLAVEAALGVEGGFVEGSLLRARGRKGKRRDAGVAVGKGTSETWRICLVAGRWVALWASSVGEGGGGRCVQEVEWSC